MSDLKAGVLLNSGLCNQLFMVFALLSYCIDNARDYIFYYDPTKMRCYWNTFFYKLKDKASIGTPEARDARDARVYEEPHFHYSKIPIIDGNITLKGYFQSAKYFEHNVQKIKDILGIDEQRLQVASEFKHLFVKKTIALHFRIGDYIGLQGYHCIKRPQYYIGAFAHMIRELTNKGEKLDDYNILYFCQEQDNPIVDQYLQILHNNFVGLQFVKVPDNIADWKQLLLMSLCDHFVIANSTFSWFGAYLQPNRGIVCYPKIWFGPLYSHDTKDLCPTGWNAIDDN